MLFKTLVSACVIALAGALPGSAATLSVSNGILTGATGVSVGGKVYSVEFVDGSCDSLFSNCASDPAASLLPAFIFTTEADARQASQALLDQVMIDSALGAFDSNPSLIRGCSENLCIAVTPFFFGLNALDQLFVFSAGAINRNSIETDIIAIYTSRSFAVTTSNFVYARWTETAVIPLPAAAWMMLSALLALGGLRLRRRWQG